MSYKGLASLVELKYQMDMANISEDDRAVVLHWNDWNHHILQGADMIAGFRIIWCNHSYNVSPRREA